MRFANLSLSLAVIGTLTLATPASSGFYGTLVEAIEVQSFIVPVAAFARCLKKCNRKASKCHRKLTKIGNKKGWDGDLRQDYWNDNCQPALDRCSANCPPLVQGECFKTYDGEQVCS